MIDFHCGDSYLQSDLPAEFAWTPQGTIDRAKTAQVLVKDENLGAIMRYKLACFYCLEDDIQKLSKEIPEDFGLTSSIHKNIPLNLVFYWTCKMKNCSIIDFSYKSVFEHCISFGNKTAAMYFLKLLSPKEMEEVNIKMYEDGDFLCFLLSELEEQQQDVIFKSDPFTVLQCLLDWPAQFFFIDTANRMWDYLSKEDYFNVLQMIDHRIVNGCKDWDYKQLFREFWQITPDALKNFDSGKLNKRHLLFLLSKIKDIGILQLILQDVSCAIKKELIHSFAMRNFFLRLITHQRWDYLEWFIRECMLSEDEKLKFKEAFEETCMCQSEYHLLAWNKSKWNQLFNLPDDSVCKFGKRSLEEGEISNSSKRPTSTHK